MAAECVVCCLLVLTSVVCATQLPPPCDSDIYCYGDLLHTVQLAGIESDSKTFVDMKMKYPRDEIWQRFNTLMNRTRETPSPEELLNFVNETFDPPGSEFETWDPVDWHPSPKFLNKIKDIELRYWANHLHGFWKQLGRKMKDEVKREQDLYSIIYVPNPVIVPGGRFREFYYWDSYWIVRGLLLSEMHGTVKGMLENFLSMVGRFGFIPNGGRVYYSRRSQPPLLMPMIKSYMDATNDMDFLRKNIHTMEQEFLHWMRNHTVTVMKDGRYYELARYYAPSSGPRPESYAEDFETAKVFHTDAEKQEYYIQLKSAAESGWDFSTRWFVQNGTNSGNLSDTKTQYIVPVELNALLFWNARLLSQFYESLGDEMQAATYAHKAGHILQAVQAVLWNEKAGIWLDYDTINNVSRDYFYPTNFAPLWTRCFDGRLEIGKIIKYLERSRIMVYLGGIPTSKEFSGEQWDFPNAWPPLQYVVIMGLDASGDRWAKEVAYQMAVKWIRSNYKAFNDTQLMFEKYDATAIGGGGSGGEYINQIGFGWTNGVVMELLDKYGHIMTVNDHFFPHEAQEEHGNSAHHEAQEEHGNAAAVRTSVGTYVITTLTFISCALSLL